MRHLYDWPLFSLFSILLFSQLLTTAATITVGPMGQYPTPCAGFSAAQTGDTVEIDAAGNYTGDVCYIGTSNLTILGVNGRPHIDAGGNNAYGKGIGVVDGDNTVIENIELSGATVTDQNGEAIRLEATNLP